VSTREQTPINGKQRRARSAARRFDKAYYDRYYRNPETRAVSPAATRRQAAFIAAYLRHLGIGVGSILDLGCGTGVMLRSLGREYPRARTEGVEVSSYLCRRHGWTAGSVVDFRAEGTFDLVVCNDVLAYLDDDDCGRALRNLASLCDAALYLGVLTREDLPLCDRQRTDAAQKPRLSSFYRRRLARHFMAVGGGLYLKKPVEVAVWHLERGR
jgi:SAM-dependent methyltransferase